MRSPRSRFETACRVGAFALLGWLLGGSVFPSGGRRLERAMGAGVEAELGAWSRRPRTVAFHATLPVTPAAWATDWLAALRHAGRVVTWDGSPPPVLMSAEAVADPGGGVRVDVAAPTAASVALRDDASPIDSLRVEHFGATLVTPIAVGSLRGDLRGQQLAVAVPAPARIRALVVIGAAGWEGKYIVSALEERGWPVAARFAIAPNVVVQSPSDGLDTSRVAAVIALDSTVESVGRGGALERFVRSGGGLILVGRAGVSSVAAPIAPASLGVRTRSTLRLTDTVRLGSSGYYPLTQLKEDGVALERRADGLVVAARRVGAGRVIQIGYDDTWRWRMAGGRGSEAAHREWWSRVVSSVAYAGGGVPAAGCAAFGAACDEAGAAPLAYLVDRLGPPRAAPPDAPARPIDRRILLALILALLLAEWSSRRLRGLR